MLIVLRRLTTNSYGRGGVQGFDTGFSSFSMCLQLAIALLLYQGALQSASLSSLRPAQSHSLAFDASFRLSLEVVSGKAGQVGQTEAVKPFSGSNEQGLTGKGGKYSKGDPWTSHVVVAEGGKLITGQNPQSAEAFAEAVVKALA